MATDDDSLFAVLSRSNDIVTLEGEEAASLLASALDWRPHQTGKTAWRFDESDPRTSFAFVYDHSPRAFRQFFEPFEHLEACVMLIERHRPKPVFEGKVGAILDCVMDANFEEFVLFDRRGDWAIWDTHHNALLCQGVIELGDVTDRDQPGAG